MQSRHTIQINDDTEGQNFWEVTDAFFGNIENNFELKADDVSETLKMEIDRYFDIDGRKEVFNLIKKHAHEEVA